MMFFILLIICLTLALHDSDICLCGFISGVYLCKHADLLQPSAFHNGQTGYLVVFKILKVTFCKFYCLYAFADSN